MRTLWITEKRKSKFIFNKKIYLIYYFFLKEDSSQTRNLIEEQSHIRVIAKFSSKFDESLKNLIVRMNENT